MRTAKREKLWNDFEQWCHNRRLRSLPAHPWTLAAYVRWCETRHRYPAILERIRTIARIHLLACAAAPDRHPTVMRTLRTLELRNRTHAGRAALFPADEVTAVAEAVPAAAAGARPRRSRPRRTERVLRSAPPLVRRRPKG
jgi:hypothetical protein